VRLSPVLAHEILGASPELGGTVVALDDLWGRDATRTEEQLRAAASWDDRFASRRRANGNGTAVDGASADALLGATSRESTASPRAKRRPEPEGRDGGWAG
jgi:hypothetical protein